MPKTLWQSEDIFLNSKKQIFYTHDYVTGKIASHIPNNNAIRANFHENNGINYLQVKR